MHDKNGREIKTGDFVKAPNTKSWKDGSGKIVGTDTFVVGKAHALNSGTETCNLNVCYPVMGGTSNLCATAKECEVLLNADGTELSPLSK